MAFKCFFSGVEGDQHFEAAVAAGATHVLMSFMYLEKKGLHTIATRKKKYPQVNFMLDSSAHTFQLRCHEMPYRNWKIADYESFLKRYIEFLKVNHKLLYCAVELDIDYPMNVCTGNEKNSSVGVSIVESWQEKYFLPLQRDYGLEICYVWHPARGEQKWEEMCQRFSYVGLPGEFSSRPDFNKYMTVAKRYMAKVHAFAGTKQSDFRDWPWRSGDSVTWKTSEMYGTLIHWNESRRKLEFIEDKSRRAEFRRFFEKAGLNADAMIKENPKQIAYKHMTRYALHSIRSMEKFYEKLFKERDYYYDRRLPQPTVLQSGKRAEVLDYWQLLKPESNLVAFAKETDVEKIRSYLVAISMAQNGLVRQIKQGSAEDEFMRILLPSMIENNVEPVVVQRALSDMLMPMNDPALKRTEPAHYESSDIEAKIRGDGFSLADLEDELDDYILRLQI